MLKDQTLAKYVCPLQIHVYPESFLCQEYSINYTLNIFYFIDGYLIFVIRHTDFLTCSMQYKKMELEEALEFAEFLKSDKMLEVADLRWNIICSNGVIEIANSLWRNKTLHTLK